MIRVYRKWHLGKRLKKLNLPIKPQSRHFSIRENFFIPSLIVNDNVFTNLRYTAILFNNLSSKPYILFVNDNALP